MFIGLSIGMGHVHSIKHQARQDVSGQQVSPGDVVWMQDLRSKVPAGRCDLLGPALVGS